MMLPDALLDALWRAHAGLTLGLLAVALLRRPWRRLAGAQAACALWLLPPWLALATLLPAAGLPALTLPPVSIAAPSGLAALSLPPGDWRALAEALWAAGMLVVIVLHGLTHHRYRRRLQSRGAAGWLAPAGDSPGLLGAWRPRLVLPADFAQRFAADERRWIVAHEATHARRLDNAARLAAAALASLAWFNPLAWWALHALRQDQELACDATVMQRFPGSWRRYGLALLKLDGATGLPPTAAAWQAHHPLKERIMWLKNNAAPRAGTRQAARAMLALGALLGLVAMQTISSAADAAPPARKLKAYEACTKMPRPELPVEVATGEYLLDVTFTIDSDGRPDTLRIQGDRQNIAPLVAAIERSVRAYECKPALAGTEVQQEFKFKID
ncbi:M56 family metallopeptidase [Pelomonas cellulosilytica]|nr:M56 family metallopeptidase [Pelomonas sp. P8]